MGKEREGGTATNENGMDANGKTASSNGKTASSREKLTVGTRVGYTEVAAVLGVTGRRVQQLAHDGIFESEKGKYNLTQCVQRYLEMKVADVSVSTDEREKHETAIKKAKAIIAELEAKEMQGKMHRSEDVEAVTEGLVFTIRSMLVALPGRLAMEIPTNGSVAEKAEVIRNEIYGLMEALAGYQYNPRDYEEKVRDRRKWEAIQEHDHEQAK